MTAILKSCADDGGPADPSAYRCGGLDGAQTVSTDSPAGLVARAVSGDPAAFEALYRRHQGRVASVLRRLAGQSNHEDLSQEAFLNAFWRLGQLRDGERFERWLLRITRNVAHRDSRRRKCFPLPERVALLPGREPGPDGLAQLEEEKQRLRRCLAELSPRDQAVLVLYHVEGLSHAEIAARQGGSENAIAARLSRARRRLRRLFEKEQRPAGSSR